MGCQIKAEVLMDGGLWASLVGVDFTLSVCSCQTLIESNVFLPHPGIEADPPSRPSPTGLSALS